MRFAKCGVTTTRPTRSDSARRNTLGVAHLVVSVGEEGLTLARLFDGAAGTRAQRKDVLLRGTGFLGGIGDNSQVVGGGQPTLVTVHDVDPGGYLTVVGMNPDPNLYEDAKCGAFPLV